MKPQMLFSKYIFSATAVMLLAGCSIFAQDNKKPEKELPGNKKLKEYDEIIIKRKNNDANQKVVIEIKDDKVFVDGKPIEDFADGEISVRIRRPETFTLTGPPSAFRNQDNWSWKGEEKAFLGVATEGTTNGAEITMVSENSAAEKAGLKKGDIITKVNDKEVFDHEQLSEAIGKLKPKDKVAITYKRDGKENKTTVTLGERPAVMGYGTIPRTPNGQMAPLPPGAPMPPMPFNFDRDDWKDMFKNYRNEKPRLGIKVQDTEDGKGVKVLDVDDGSAADKSGIKEDDIIITFDGKAVNSAQELSEASRDAKEKSSLKVQLKRNGKTQTIDVKVPKKLKTAEL